MSSSWKVLVVKGSYETTFKIVDEDNRTIANVVGDQLNPNGLSIGEAREVAELIVAAVREYTPSA